MRQATTRARATDGRVRLDAADEREAIEKAAREFKQHATKLIAVQRE
jgi:hypothetical protein